MYECVGGVGWGGVCSCVSGCAGMRACSCVYLWVHGACMKTFFVWPRSTDIN